MESESQACWPSALPLGYTLIPDSPTPEVDKQNDSHRPQHPEPSTGMHGAASASEEGHKNHSSLAHWGKEGGGRWPHPACSLPDLPHQNLAPGDSNLGVSIFTKRVEKQWGQSGNIPQRGCKTLQLLREASLATGKPSHREQTQCV